MAGYPPPADTAVTVPVDWRNEARLCREDGHPHAALAAMAYALFGWHFQNGTRPLCEVNPDAWDELDLYRRTLGLPDWSELDTRH